MSDKPTTLTVDAVNKIMLICLFAEYEDMADAIKVEGIVNNYAFHPQRIHEHAAEISRLLSELPTEFQATGGGGWSFLNACNDKHGNQWTGLHQQMERLFALGIAAGKARWLFPRDMWAMLPGSVPYVSVN